MDRERGAPGRVDGTRRSRSSPTGAGRTRRCARPPSVVGQPLQPLGRPPHHRSAAGREWTVTHHQEGAQLAAGGAYGAARATQAGASVAPRRLLPPPAADASPARVGRAPLARPCRPPPTVHRVWRPLGQRLGEALHRPGAGRPAGPRDRRHPWEAQVLLEPGRPTSTQIRPHRSLGNRRPAPDTLRPTAVGLATAAATTPRQEARIARLTETLRQRLGTGQ